MSSIAEEFAARGFRADFRRYQRLALEHGRVAGDATCYVVMPPGAGKTVVGLELARRIGRRTLVLVPNTAVLGQWASTWDERFPAGDAREVAPCATDRSLDAPLTVLTYQSLAVIDDGHAAAERRCAVRGRDHEALLAMLHPNGRELVARAAATGPWTLVLDECHHLLDTWGALVGALVDELGAGTTVIGLTATPPRLLTGWQRELHDDLFGTADVEVPAPALVRDGDLAPYQELVYLTAPTPEEDGWLVTEAARFADLQVELVDRRLGTVPLLTWVQRRVGDRCDLSGARRSWGGFERAEPALAVAVLRLAYAGILPVPDGARLREEHRVQPSSHDWVVVLADFCTGHLRHSEDPADVAALASITRVLPGLGYRLTARGSQATTSPVDRLCGLSAAKVGAAAHILDAESGALGADLRALVLCDFEAAAARLPSGLADAGVEAESGSARLAFASLARAEVGSGDAAGGLLPLLVTGSVFACPVALGAGIVAACAGVGYAVSTRPFDGAPDLIEVTGGSDFTARRWVPIATRHFAAGRARVIVGTRALLGEGWDCAAVNVVIDLTTATTPTAVTQLRGRSLRLDPRRPDKLADNWAVCCVSDEHPRGTADYDRLVRKHEAYFAPTDGGEIESGVSHCDPVFSPYAPPVAAEREQASARAIARVAARGAARGRWRLGTPYDGTEVTTVRVRAGRSMGVDTTGLPRAAVTPTSFGRAGRGRGRPALCLGAGTASGVVVGIAAAAASGAVTGALVTLAGAAVAVVAPSLAWARRPSGTSAGLGGDGVGRGAARRGDTGALERLAAAVAAGMHAAGGLSRGAGAVTFEVTGDGWTRCSVSGVPTAEAQRFASALDELLAPLAEPRQLVGRLVLTPPPTLTGRLRVALRASLGLGLDAAVVWHAMPSWFARGARRQREFLAAWATYVGPPRSLAADSLQGQAVLELFRGADPFSVLTQLRTLWR